MFNSFLLDLSNDNLNVVYYLSGWLCSFMCGDTFKVTNKDFGTVDSIRRMVCKNLKIYFNKRQATFSFKSKKLSKDCKFNCEYILASESRYKIDFLRGITEARGQILPNDKILFDTNINVIEPILISLDIAYSKHTDGFITVSNLIDFLGALYTDAIKQWKSKAESFYETILKSTYFCATVDSVVPLAKKTHMTDAGTDISATYVAEELESGITLLGTGINIKIPQGYWGMLAPRSSISKSGWGVANSFGVIDSSYRGEIKIAVTKLTDSALPLQFPWRCAQLILIPQIQIVNSVVEQLGMTNRGNGGYGST
jgi:dUTP pyrophosphatase